MTIQCPECGQDVQVPNGHADRTLACPSCKKPFVVQFVPPADAPQTAILKRVEPKPAQHPPATPAPPLAGYALTRIRLPWADVWRLGWQVFVVACAFAAGVAFIVSTLPDSPRP
jgi:DNA-directed RNA polymerase subunit RPC12/RpoP